MCGVQTIRYWINKEYQIVPVDLEVGDWYKIKSMTVVRRWAQASWQNTIALSLEVKIADKDRKWIRDRFPKGAKYCSRTLEVRPADINGNVEIYKTKEEAMARAAELRGVVPPDTRMNRFKRVT